MYRMTRHTPLATGQQYGDIIRDGELKASTIKALLARGILAEVVTPPLAELSECWKRRADKLAKANIVTIDDFIQAEVSRVAKTIRMSQTTIRRWQQEAIDYLRPPEIGQQTKKGK